MSKAQIAVAAQDDPVSSRVLARAKLVGLSLAYLSGKLGKNPSYVHQWLAYCKPWNLNEEDRRDIARLLDLQEEELKRPRRVNKLARTVTDSRVSEGDAPAEGVTRRTTMSTPRKRLINVCLDLPEPLVATALRQIEALMTIPTMPPDGADPRPQQRGET